MKNKEAQLIAKQQLQIENFKEIAKSNKELLNKLHMEFYAIGAPLNDNKLEFNREQRKWAHNVIQLIEQIDTNPFIDEEE